MRPRRSRGQRGVVFPSPVVILSVVAVAMAGVAFLFTHGSGSSEQQVTVSSQQSSTSTAAAPSGSATAAPGAASASGKASPKPKPTPAVDRASTPVVVFNNSGVSGLAAQVATKVGQAGWQVLGADNWYGTIPTTTVYYPATMQAAGKQLALDLGISRTAPAVDPMRTDRLTLILTGPLS